MGLSTENKCHCYLLGYSTIKPKTRIMVRPLQVAMRVKNLSILLYYDSGRHDVSRFANEIFLGGFVVSKICIEYGKVLILSRWYLILVQNLLSNLYRLV